VNLESGELSKCVVRKTAPFLDAKIDNAPRTFFINLIKAKTSKMRLNSTANSFIFGRKNQDNAPITFL